MGDGHACMIHESEWGLSALRPFIACSLTNSRIAIVHSNITSNDIIFYHHISRSSGFDEVAMSRGKAVMSFEPSLIVDSPERSLAVANATRSGRPRLGSALSLKLYLACYSLGARVSEAQPQRPTSHTLDPRLAQLHRGVPLSSVGMLESQGVQDALCCFSVLTCVEVRDAEVIQRANKVGVKGEGSEIVLDGFGWSARVGQRCS